MVWVGLVFLITFISALPALIAAWLVPGESGIGPLLRPVLRWRVDARWYLLALVGPTVLFVVAVGIHVVVDGAPATSWLSIPRGADLTFLVGALVAGSFGEEVGWRGFALPRLQACYTPLVGSVIVGVIWATWHLWPVITPGGGSITWLVALETYVRLLATSVIYGWIFNATGGSVLLVMLAHVGHNIAVRVTPAPPLLVAALYLIAAVIVVLSTRATKMKGSAARGSALQRPQ